MAMNKTGGVLSGNNSDKNYGVMMGQTMASMQTNATGAAEGVASIHQIVTGITEDLRNLRERMEILPPMPKGKYLWFFNFDIFDFVGETVPAPLAKFQNNVIKIEKELYNNIGQNNRKVFPKIDTKA